MSRDYKVVCLSESLSPISHSKGASGNVSLNNTEAVATPRGKVEVSMLSGNAIRHRLVRAPGWRWLFAEYGLEGKLDLARLNFGLHGGNLTEGGGRENTARIAEFQRIFPLGRLVGGCLPDQILDGSLVAFRGTLVCEENRAVIEHDAGGAMAGVGRLRPAATFLDEYQYVRGDAARTAADLKPIDPPGDRASNQMIFSGQCVVRGALWLHGFVLPHATERELGALLWSLSLWQSAGGTIGGQSARGHGRLRTSILSGDWDGEAAIDAYLDHARSARDEAVAWLESTFAEKPEKPAKGGRAKAKSGVPAA